MGAGQSTEGGARSHGATQEVKTSYYELLGVDRSATDEEIKKAYRRKALSLHPDRNYGHEEEATKEFATVQSAYEVLSDPQERAWYDSHEVAILRDIDPSAAAQDGQEGGAGYEASVGLTTADDVTRLVRKFHGGVEFSDSPSGFFGFLREFFEQLAMEEEQAARRQDLDAPDYPSFGHKDDTHEDGVRQFYGAWAGFGTVKSFSWRDRYRMSNAEDRRMRRLIEKENARFRKEGMQEFNDAVRSMVAFVRKRDPRYTPNTQTEAERQKVLQDTSKAQAARMRAKHAEKVNAEDALPEWARKREDARADGAGVEEGTFEESSSEEEHFECVACRKTFKSEKQYEAHEKSNKHKKAVQALRRKLQKEGHRVGVDEDQGQDEDEDDAVADEAERTHQSGPETGDGLLNGKGHDDEGSSEDLQKKGAEELANDLQDSHLNEKTGVNDDEEVSSDAGSTVSSPNSGQDGSDEMTPAISTLSPESEPSTSVPKKGKAAQKREKKAAKAAEVDSTDLKHKCAMCASAFESKTQLFQHIKNNGHAAPIPQGKYKQRSTAGKKKKKG